MMRALILGALALTLSGSVWADDSTVSQMPADADNSQMAAEPATIASEPEATARTDTDSSAKAAPASSGSQESDYIAGLGTYTFNDKKRRKGVERGVGGQFLYGHQFPSQFGYEIGGFIDTFETGANAGTDFYRQGVGLDLFYALSDRRGFTPFVLVGGGGTRNDVWPSNKDGYSWYANAGVGFVTGPLAESFPLKLRLEGRYVLDGWQEKPRDVRVGLGFEIAIGEKHHVDAQGKPEVKVVEVQKVVEVPTGLTDSDGDGVIDSADKCPDTPPHTRVDGDGCPLGKIIALKGLHFEFNKTRIMPDGETILNWASGLLKKYPDMQVEVAGHTDSVGSASYNQKLSEKRAQAVKDFLVKTGVPETQMSVKGYGKAEPVDSNDTDAGRERNRRVELRILN